MERDGETGGEDGCASGGRHQEQSKGVGATLLAVMEADVLWSNGNCVCLCLSVSGMRASVCVSVPRFDTCVCVQSVTSVCVCTVCVFLVDALQFCNGIKAM